MAGWTNEHLSQIDAAQELDLGTVRQDGTLPRQVRPLPRPNGPDHES